MATTSPSASTSSNTSSNTSKKTSGSASGGFMALISQFDSLIVFGGFFVAIIGTIILAGLFQAGDTVRSNLLFNAAGAVGMAFMFIYVIFKFMGEKLVILGKPFDVGMIIYIAIIIFVMLIFGN
jgi:hypothetical protein